MILLYTSHSEQEVAPMDLAAEQVEGWVVEQVVGQGLELQWT